MNKEDYGNWQDIPEEEKDDNDRMWEHQFNKWANNDCVADKENPFPGEHPRKYHLWNIDKQAYLDLKKIDYNVDDPDCQEKRDDY